MVAKTRIADDHGSVAKAETVDDCVTVTKVLLATVLQWRRTLQAAKNCLYSVTVEATMDSD